MGNENNMSAFLEMWNGLEEVAFKKEWENGTGYLNTACAETPTVAVRFEDDAGRKGILLPVEGGAMVVFQRYTNGDGDIIVSHSRPELFPGELKAHDVSIVRKLLVRKLTAEEVKEYANKQFAYLEEGSYKETNRRRTINRFKDLGLIA